MMIAEKNLEAGQTEESQFITPKEMMNILRISSKTTYMLLKTQIPHYRLQKKILIDRNQFFDWLSNH
jgi:hypothetical protein